MKQIVVVIILLLIVSQIYLFYKNDQLRSIVSVKDLCLEDLITKLSSIEPQYPLNMQNVGKIIRYDVVVKDSVKNESSLIDIIQNMGNNVLVCRFSERYCRQCVQHTVSVILDNKSSFDFSHIIFLSDNKSNRVFNLNIREFGLSGYNVFNCYDLGIPIDHIMFPYYMIVDSNLKVLAVYAPSKSTHGTDFDFKNVKLMFDNLVDKQ